MHYDVKLNEVSAHGANIYLSLRMIPVNPDDPSNSSGATEDEVAKAARDLAQLIQFDATEVIAGVKKLHAPVAVEEVEVPAPSTPDEPTESASPGTGESTSDVPVS